MNITDEMVERAADHIRGDWAVRQLGLSAEYIQQLTRSALTAALGDVDAERLYVDSVIRAIEDDDGLDVVGPLGDVEPVPTHRLDQIREVRVLDANYGVGYLAFDDDFDVVGYGETKQDAINDLIASIRDAVARAAGDALPERRGE